MIITALGAGAIFGADLALSGMLTPAKVLGFFDVFGMWDPALGMVMAGGTLVNATGHYFVMKGHRPVFDTRFELPTSNNIDRPLLIESAIFDIGWGLAGYCPGPVVASLLLEPVVMLPFLVTLLAGAFAGRWLRS